MKTIKKWNVKLFILLLATAGLFTACKKNNEETKVSVQLTDDPFPAQFITEANVEITKVEIKNDQSEYVTVFQGHNTINIAQYTNGSTTEVTIANVPVGTYTGVRITVGDVSVKMTDNTIFEYSGSAGAQYEVNVEPALEVSEGDVGDLLVDLDLSESFNFSGSFMGNWISNIAQITGINSFNADIRAVALNKTGSISGTVKDTNDNTIAYADVKVQYDYDGDGIAENVTTSTEANGSFKIIGLPQGTYNIKVTTENNGSAQINNIDVAVRHNAEVNLVVQ